MRVFLFALTLFLTTTCATDPGSTVGTTGAGVTLTYEGADLDAVLNVVRASRSTKFYLYVWVFFKEGVNIATLLTPNLTTEFVSVLVTLPDSCSASATLEHYEDYPSAMAPTNRLLTYSTDCEISTNAVVTAQAVGKVAYAGSSRLINGSASGSGGGGGSPSLTHHTVFATSTLHTGALGGLTGADSICQTRAAAGSVTSSLSGTWRAILSDSTNSAASRLNFSSIPIKNTGGETVVSSASSLWSGSIENQIRYDENGSEVVSQVNTWSATESDGSGNGVDCLDWTDGGGEYGSRGLTTEVNYRWIDAGIAWFCVSDLHLYCINAND